MFVSMYVCVCKHYGTCVHPWIDISDVGLDCMYVFVFDLESYLCMYVPASKAEQLHAAADTFLNELKTSLEKSEELNKKVVYSFMYMYVHMNAGTYVHECSCQCFPHSSLQSVMYV